MRRKRKKTKQCACDLALVDGKCPAGCEQRRRPHRGVKPAGQVER